MLYEVITSGCNFPLRAMPSMVVIAFPLAAETGTSQDRITSYNVCYTKLLRVTLACLVFAERVAKLVGERGLLAFERLMRNNFV